jgi:short-subunit dehydrogenase
MEAIPLNSIELLPVSPLLAYILMGLGGLLLASKAINVLRYLSSNILRRTYNFSDRYGRGSWVLVTGATGSIGYAFCEQFAEQGLNVVLVGRSTKKLKLKSNELKKAYSDVQTRIVTRDFIDSAMAGWAEGIAQEVDDLDISVLVSVAGMENLAIPFDDDPLDNTRATLIINTLPVVLLTHALIKKLAGRKQRSAVITVAAESGKNPYPGMAVYGGSKALANNFTIAVSKEYQDSVDVLSVNPLGVTSNMVDLEPDGLVVCTAEQCVRASLKQLGHRRETSGWWTHTIQSKFIAALPSEIRLFVWPKVVQNYLDNAAHKKT